MSLILDGSLGLSDVDGSAATPAIRGTDSNTGMFFGTDIVGLSTGGAERVRIDSAGNLTLGGNPSSAVSFYNRRNISGGTTAYGNYTNAEIQSDVTATVYGYRSNLSTQAASFTLGQINHYRANQGTFGAGSTVTTQYGFIADNTLTGATNNYGFWSGIGAGTGRWGFYAAGTADNYFAGNVGIGVTPSAWSQGKVAEIGGLGNAMWGNGVADFYMTSNVYYQGGWKYASGNSAGVGVYEINGNAHYWYGSPSGTTGNTATLTTILQVKQGNTLSLQGAAVTAGTGITFPTTQSASTDANTLDDYEEGSFTPVFATDGTQPTYTVTNAFGYYTKIGRMVYYNFYIYSAGGATGGTGNVAISGFPFTITSPSSYIRGFPGYLAWGGLSGKWTPSASSGIGWQPSINTTSMVLYANNTAYANGAFEVAGTGFYFN